MGLTRLVPVLSLLPAGERTYEEAPMPGLGSAKRGWRGVPPHLAQPHPERVPRDLDKAEPSVDRPA
jgi:hypothetical protein